MTFFIDCWQFSAAAPCQKTDFAMTDTLVTHCWYHLQRDQPGIREWLLSNNIVPSLVDSFLTEDTRPLFEQYHDDAFLLILRGMNFNQHANPEDMLSLRILYYQGALITSRKIPSKTVAMIRDKLAQGQGPANLSDLVANIIDGLNHNIDHYLTKMEDSIAEFDDQTELSEELMQAHKALLKIKRFIKPQQYAIEDYRNADHPLPQQSALTLRHSINTIIRINETLDFYLGELEVIKGELRQYHAEKMNKNTYLFSIIAAIFLPTSFLTGLLGVNIGGIPGVEASTAFTLFCMALIVIFGAEIWVLRRLHFFSK